MTEKLVTLRQEHELLIASFADAMAEVADIKGERAEQARQYLQASLAGALGTLAASLANSVADVSDEAFAEKASDFRTRLQQKGRAFRKLVKS